MHPLHHQRQRIDKSAAASAKRSQFPDKGIGAAQARLRRPQQPFDIVADPVRQLNETVFRQQSADRSLSFQNAGEHGFDQRDHGGDLGDRPVETDRCD